MSQPARTESEARSAGRDLVEAWADYTKTVGMYPATSARVGTRLEVLLQAIAAVKADRGTAVVRMTPEELSAGGEGFPLNPGTKALWLQRRMHKSALEGVAFFGGEAREGLPAFTNQLLANYARQTEIDPDRMWPDTYPGIELIHLRFGQGFHGGGPTVYVPPSLESSPAPALPLVETDEPASNVPLSTRLAQEASLIARMAAVRDRLRNAGLLAGDDEEGEQITDELMKQLIRTLPEDQPEYGGLVQIAEGMLECLDDYLGNSSDGVAQRGMGPSELKALMFMSSRMFFRGGAQAPDPADPADEPTQEERRRGRAGDERFTADVAAFREELAALPPLPGSGLFEDAAEVRAETLHVYLHMLTRRDPEQPTHNLHRTLEGLLANVTPPELLIVRRHLRTGWDAGGARRSRILDFLRKSSQMRLLRRCGVLTEASMESSFPDDFDIYLETIDLTEDADRGELRRLLGGIDDARIVRAVPGLIEQLGAEAARELLAFDARQTLAFAPVLLRARDPVALELIKKRLRQMRPDMAVARLMDLTTDPATITPEYLADLVDVLMGKPLSLQLCTYVAGCLQATVEELAATEGPESPGRIQAIRVIGKLGVPTGTAFLRDMMRRRKLVVFPAEPRRVREAIVDVLSGRPTAGWAA